MAVRTRVTSLMVGGKVLVRSWPVSANDLDRKGRCFWGVKPRLLALKTPANPIEFIVFNARAMARKSQR